MKRLLFNFSNILFLFFSPVILAVLTIQVIWQLVKERN